MYFCLINLIRTLLAGFSALLIASPSLTQILLSSLAHASSACGLLHNERGAGEGKTMSH